ncbi:IclR family transcriptional regulator [Brevibacillus reuszeri]|uniref:IclR family transcriptional regulator n=1 Tax=Brevibacillus reuszeri TaxID=54915 RepID=UPI000CCC562B|nr:IclR family transcriptional regulator [Brevibacillus reuszeri]
MSLKTLDISLRLLAYFDHNHTSWGVRELAKEMDVSHSIVHRILSTFEEHGFMKQNLETKKYELGLKFWDYSGLVQENHSITDIVYPVMKRMSTEAGESISLNWLDGDEGICVAIVESPQSVKFTMTIGTRTNLYRGARSKTILAFLSEVRQREILNDIFLDPEELTYPVPTDPDVIVQELREIRKKGWCYTVGERTPSVVGLSVPLFNAKQEVIASLTFAGPEYRMPEDKIEVTLRILKTGQKEIQEQFNKMNQPFIEKETRRFRR